MGSPVIYLTGSTGFIGKNLCVGLKNDFDVKPLQRKKCKSGEFYYELPNFPLNVSENSQKLLIHCAGLAHDNKRLQHSVYESSNVHLTERVLKLAVSLDVDTFILMSSAKVYGEFSQNRVYSENDLTVPETPYAISKLFAEKMVQDFCKLKSMNYYTLRLPVTYGESMNGNLKIFENFARNRIPFPFMITSNKKSMCHVQNITSFLKAIIFTRKKISGIYNICDDRVYSTEDIVVSCYHKLGRKRQKYLTLPNILLRYISNFLPNLKLHEKLTSNLVISNSKAKELTEWLPLQSLHRK